MTHITIERAKLEQMLKALKSTSGLPHWPAIFATIADFEQALAAQAQEPVAQWNTVHKAVANAIDKCKAASGMHRAIDLVVNAAQITHDTLGTDTTPPAAPVQDSDHEFKNFHRVLCERFGYTHDEVDWKRDQISLIEWIAKQVKPAAPVQEPVAWMDASGDIYKHELWPDWNPPHTPLYTTPPVAQRQWVGLTDEEAERCRRGTWQATFRAIGALLREKNGGKA